MSRSPGLRGDEAAAAAPQGVADRRELAFIAVERTRMPMVATDPRRPDNPMVLANRAFLSLTGYEPAEIIGRNCRMLQGPDTSREAAAAIRAGLQAEREVEVELLNYRKDGSTFWNRVYISPIHDEDGRLVYFFGSQLDITEQRKLEALEASEHRLLREVDHRALNALAIVESIVRLTRADNAALYAAAVQRRVHALAQAHALLAARGWTEVPLGDIVRSQLAPYGSAQVRVAGPDSPVPGDKVQPLALVFHELASNAAVHGALSRPDGELRVSWTPEPEGGAVAVDWEETGAPQPDAPRRRGFGAVIVDAVVSRQLGGEVRQLWTPRGLHARLVVPLGGPA